MTAPGEEWSSVSQVGSRVSVSSIPPSLPPPEDEQSPELVAARLLARGVGVPEPTSALVLVATALGRAVKRLGAIPLAIAIAGWIAVLAWLPPLLLARGWAHKLKVAVAAPFAVVFGAAWVAARYALRGNVRATAVVARLLHRFAPVLTFPKSAAHQMFGLVVVSGYRDVRTVLERDDVFSVEGYAPRMHATAGDFFLGMDPSAQYTREQQLGAAALGRDVTYLRECVARMSRATVEGALERPSRTLDVVTELVRGVQRQLLHRYFGVPDTPDERVLEWFETMSFFIFNLWIGGPYEAAAIDAGRRMTEHLRNVVSARLTEIEGKGAFTDDVLGRMLEHARGSDGKVDEALVVRTMAGVVSGAMVAANGTFVQAVDRLLDVPAGARRGLQRAALTGHDETVRRFVREAARFAAYPPTLYRRAVKPYVFHAGTPREKEVEAGAWVLTAPIWANYDASIFRRPEKFEPHRQESKDGGPLLFGWARHRCLGEHMAELLMVEMAKALFARDVRRATGPAGFLEPGPKGAIPAGDFARRLVVRFVV